MTGPARARRSFEDVFVSLGATALDCVRFWTLYRNARRRGMGCARACYLAFYLLDYSLEETAHAVGQSRHTIDSQVQRGYGDLRKLGLKLRGKGDAATFLMVGVPRADRCAPRKRPHQHPLWRAPKTSDWGPTADRDEGRRIAHESRSGDNDSDRCGNERARIDSAADRVVDHLRRRR